MYAPWQHRKLMRELTANVVLNRHVSKAASAFFSSYTSVFS